MQLWQITRKIHVSWLIALLSLSFVVGVALVPHVGQTWFAGASWFAVGLVLIMLGLWRQRVYALPVVALGGILVGLWHGSLLYTQFDVYKHLIGMTTVVSGTVTDDPDRGKQGDTVLRLGDVMVDGHAVTGAVWVSTFEGKDIWRSDRVTVRGKLSQGFGNFGVTMYRASVQKVERPQPGDVALRVRDWFADLVRVAIAEPQASLGLGYLLGQRRALPPELDQALVIAGLTHVVVASGYNLTILVRLARRLFVKVSKYLAAVSSGSMIVAFVAITGASPSMTRAGLVAGLSLAAWYYGRKFHPLVLLPFAAALTVIINPAYAWNDLGWQLSFAAFAGVMIMAPLLQRYFFGDKKPGTVRQILGETVSASIVTLPILVYAFGQFSNVALIANLLVLPLVPLAMLLTSIAGIAALVAPPLATIVGLPAQWLLTYMTSAAQYLAGLPWAQTIMEIPAWSVWIAYALIVAVCVYMWRVTKYNLRDSNIVE